MHGKLIVMLKKSKKPADAPPLSVRFKHSGHRNTETTPTLEELHRVMSALGRRGGRKGGPARAAKLTSKQRSEIARRAAIARWTASEKE